MSLEALTALAGTFPRARGLGILVCPCPAFFFGDWRMVTQRGGAGKVVGVLLSGWSLDSTVSSARGH